MSHSPSQQASRPLSVSREIKFYDVAQDPQEESSPHIHLAFTRSLSLKGLFFIRLLISSVLNLALLGPSLAKFFQCDFRLVSCCSANAPTVSLNMPWSGSFVSLSFKFNSHHVRIREMTVVLDIHPGSGANQIRSLNLAPPGDLLV